MINLQHQLGHQAIVKLELDCSEAVSVSLTDGGLWVVVEIEKDSQCILRGYLPSLGLDPNGMSIMMLWRCFLFAAQSWITIFESDSITTSGTLSYTQDTDLQGECYIAGTVRFGYVGIYFSCNGKTIGIVSKSGHSWRSEEKLTHLSHL